MIFYTMMRKKFIFVKHLTLVCPKLKSEFKTSTYEIINQNSEAIDIFLIKLTEDQNQEVRNYARYCYILYR